MNYRVRIDDEILKAKIDRHNSIWMYRAPREKPIDIKPGGFGAEAPSFSTVPEIENSQSHNPVTDQHRPSGRACPEPTPHKNHKPKLGAWPNYTVLARAIAEKNGKPGTAGGIQQKLTNFWVPGRGRYAKANVVTRQMHESFGVVFDGDGFVKSCESVPFPLP